MICVVSAENANKVKQVLEQGGEKVHTIGHIIPRGNTPMVFKHTWSNM